MEYRAKNHYKNRNVASDYDKARFYSLRGHIVDFLEKRLVLKSIMQTGIRAPAQGLDIPCGTGRLTMMLAEKGFEVTGADISEEMLRQAVQKKEQNSYGKRVRLCVGDVETLAFEDASFDFVVSLRLFGHLPTDTRKKALAELRRVSKAAVIVAYYHKNCLQGLLRRKNRANRMLSWHPQDFRQIELELREAGLEVVKKNPLLLGVSETVVVACRKK